MTKISAALDNEDSSTTLNFCGEVLKPIASSTGRMPIGVRRTAGGQVSYADTTSQLTFAAAICRVIRESRIRQKLTQAEVAARTNGLISKAALANYETGHRGLRIDVLWVIARSLGEDIGVLIQTAERYVGHSSALDGNDWITINVDNVSASTDPRLAPVKRWFELRGKGSAGDVILDAGLIAALAALMDVSVVECRRILVAAVPGARVSTSVLPAQRQP